MGGHTPTEIPCEVCSKPVDLCVDLYVDENGKAVHSDCYVQHIAGSRTDLHTTKMAD